MTALAFLRNGTAVCASTPENEELFASNHLFESTDDLFTPELDFDPSVLIGSSDDDDERAAAQASMAEVAAGQAVLDRDAAITAAKKECFSCPLRAGCLDDAITYGHDGVWGGTTKAERDAMSGGQEPVMVIDVGALLGADIHLQDEMPANKTPDALIAFYSDVHGMQTEEIAAVLDITPRTVTRARARARAGIGTEVPTPAVAGHVAKPTATVPAKTRKAAGPPRNTPKHLNPAQVGPPTAAMYDLLSDSLPHATEELLAVCGALIPAGAAYDVGMKAHHKASLKSPNKTPKAQITRPDAERRGARALAGNRLNIMRRDQYVVQDKAAGTHTIEPAALAEWLAFRAQNPAPQTPATRPQPDETGWLAAMSQADLAAEANRLLAAAAS